MCRFNERDLQLITAFNSVRRKWDLYNKQYSDEFNAADFLYSTGPVVYRLTE